MPFNLKTSRQKGESKVHSKSYYLFATVRSLRVWQVYLFYGQPHVGCISHSRLHHIFHFTRITGSV
jgi:hypothetical protein